LNILCAAIRVRALTVDATSDASDQKAPLLTLQ
jgi:hypothetical protein